MVRESADPAAHPPGAPAWERLTVWRRLGAMLRQRCPRCCEGRLFRGRFEMNDPCPVCGLVFQREEGYFLGAMYFAYFLAVAVLCAVFFAGKAWLPGWSDYLIATMAVVLFLPLVPATVRVSRTVWIYFDRWGCWTHLPIGRFEQERSRQGRPPSGDATDKR